MCMIRVLSSDIVNKQGTQFSANQILYAIPNKPRMACVCFI